MANIQGTKVTFAQSNGTGFHQTQSKIWFYLFIFCIKQERLFLIFFSNIIDRQLLLPFLHVQFSIQDNGSAKYFQGAMHTPNMGEKVAQVSRKIQEQKNNSIFSSAETNSRPFFFFFAIPRWDWDILQFASRIINMPDQNNWLNPTRLACHTVSQHKSGCQFFAERSGLCPLSCTRDTRLTPQTR